MKRRPRTRPVLATIGLALALIAAPAGCDYSAPRAPLLPPTGAGTAPRPGAVGGSNPYGYQQQLASSDAREKREAILQNVLRLIETAYQKPGGDNFAIATENLNQYFAEEPLPADYGMSAAARNYLLATMPEDAVKQIESINFSIRDARHIEDCMLYHNIANRVAGVGDDLTRVTRVFDWMIRQVQLVPVGAFGAPSLPQVPARPYDVLMRGMATEEQGYWAERGWLFMSLCRQLGVDVGLVTYTPRGRSEPTAWLCAALIDGKAYLFDARIGLPVPGPGGEGVATLEEALDDPEILERLDLPRQSPYGTTRRELLAGDGKIGILLDSSPGYLAPKMKLLQSRLAGKDRTILYRDPAEQRDAFASALGDRLGNVGLWPLPITVITSLFTDGQFVASTQLSLQLFDSALPLLYARMAQLRGELAEAKEKFGSIRFNENPTLVDKKTPIPPQIQRALDLHATYFLALCHLESGNEKDAEFLLREMLRLTPEPGGGRPYFNMFRWGAQSNLARLCDARGESARAVQLYAQADPTYQGHGNLFRARDLIWDDPTAELPPPLPSAPDEPADTAAPGPMPSPAPGPGPLPPTGPVPSAGPVPSPFPLAGPR